MLNSENNFLTIYRKALLWGVIGLAEYHLLWSLMQFVIWDKPYLKLEKWIGVALICATVLYMIIAVVQDRKAPKAPAQAQARSSAPAAPAQAQVRSGAPAAPAQAQARPSAPAAQEGGTRPAAAAGPLDSLKQLLQRMRSPEQIFIAAFFVWYIIVCAVRTALEGKSYFAANENRMFYAALSAFVLFPLAEYVGRERVRRVVTVMLNSAVALYTPVCAWVLWNYYHGVFVKFPSGNEVNLYKGLALQIGLHRNITAAYSMILMNVCVYMLLTMKSRIKYLIYIPAALVHFIVIMLTNSRTCFIVVIAMVVLPIIVRGRKYLEKYVKVKNKALVVLGGAAVLVLCVGGLYLLRSGIIASNAEMWREKLNNPDAMKVRKMVGLNGRINIWKASIKLMFSSWDCFLFGVTPTKLPSVLWEIGKFPVKQPHCHNLIIQVGTCFGVPMMLMYTCFLVSIAIRSFRVMKYDGDRLFKTAWVIPVIIFGLLLTETMEVLTFVNVFFNLPVFFILAGWTVMMDRTIAGKNSQNSAENLKKTSE